MNATTFEEDQAMLSSLSDAEKEIYYGMKTIQDDCSCWGCYVRKHVDLELFEKVAKKFYKHDLFTDFDKHNVVIKQGYCKLVPQDDHLLMVIKDKKMRGAFPITYAEH